MIRLSAAEKFLAEVDQIVGSGVATPRPDGPGPGYQNGHPNYYSYV